MQCRAGKHNIFGTATTTLFVQRESRNKIQKRKSCHSESWIFSCFLDSGDLGSFQQHKFCVYTRVNLNDQLVEPSEALIYTLWRNTCEMTPGLLQPAGY